MTKTFITSDFLMDLYVDVNYHYDLIILQWGNYLKNEFLGSLIL